MSHAMYDNQDRWVMVESSDRMWSTGEGNGKPFQYSCLENPMNSMKRQKERTLKDELPRSVGARYAAREEWRNSSRRNEEAEPKGKQHPVVDVSGGGSKTQLSNFTFTHWRRKWQPTAVFLPGESHGRRSLVGCSPWGRTESDTTEAT